jgi:hypothetical protein
LVLYSGLIRILLVLRRACRTGLYYDCVGAGLICEFFYSSKGSDLEAARYNERRIELRIKNKYSNQQIR